MPQRSIPAAEGHWGAVSMSIWCWNVSLVAFVLCFAVLVSNDREVLTSGTIEGRLRRNQNSYYMLQTGAVIRSGFGFRFEGIVQCLSESESRLEHGEMVLRKRQSDP
jgi:hypothetical protein